MWSYSQANLVEYRQVLSNVDWDSCFQSEDINKIYENWSKKLLFSANLCIPNRHIIIRLNDKPWFNNDLRLAKRKKDRSHSKAKDELIGKRLNLIVINIVT